MDNKIRPTFVHYLSDPVLWFGGGGGEWVGWWRGEWEWEGERGHGGWLSIAQPPPVSNALNGGGVSGRGRGGMGAG